MSWIPLQHLLLAAQAQRRIASAPEINHLTFANRCLAVAGALHANSVRRAGLWFDDAAELAVALLACWRAGVTAVLPGDAHPHTLSALDADVDQWLSDRPLPGLADERVFSVCKLSGHMALPAAMLDPGVGLELSTSGSSGLPKRIIKQWSQLCQEIEALERQWNWADSPACVLGSVSPQHMYGLSFRVLWPLCAGRSIERGQLVFPEDIQAASLRDERIVWITSPALLRRLGDSPEWRDLAGAITQIFSSGGPLPTELFEALHLKLACRPTEIYGSSETGAVAWRQEDDYWQPLPGVAISVACNGALKAQSSWIATSDEQTSDAALWHGGKFELLGRLDRIVKVEEKRIALPMIEQALAHHECIAEARIGRGHGVSRLTALAALNARGLHRLRNGGRKALISSLHSHLAARFEPLAIPRHWRFLQQLPWNAQNKLPQDDFDRAAGPRPTVPVIRALPGASGDERRYAFEIPLDLAHFSGHFASTPVVPGVALIGWAMMLTQRDLRPELQFGGMEALKFQLLLRPGDTVELNLEWNATRGKLYFEYRMADAPCASGRIMAAY